MQRLLTVLTKFNFKKILLEGYLYDSNMQLFRSRLLNEQEQHDLEISDSIKSTDLFIF